MGQLDLLVLERFQEETRRAMSEHCEREGHLMQAIRRVLDSYEMLQDKAPSHVAFTASVFMAATISEARLVLGE